MAVQPKTCVRLPSSSEPSPRPLEGTHQRPAVRRGGRGAGAANGAGASIWRSRGAVLPRQQSDSNQQRGEDDDLRDNGPGLSAPIGSVRAAPG